MSSWFSDFFPDEVAAFVSDRSIDFSLEKSNPLTVEQKDYLNSQVGSSCEKLFQISQEHGDSVVIAGVSGELVEQRIRNADAALTNEISFPVAVRTADCLPVFICDPKNKAIGIVHAGWKGSKKRIVVKAVDAMKEKFGSQSNDLKIAFGPAIRLCCYEVGEEFCSNFPGEIEKRDGKYFLDLCQVNNNQLIEAGVSQNNISDCKICTCCDPRFHSYRRDGNKAGRILALIVLTG